MTISAIWGSYWMPELQQSKEMQKIPSNDSLHNNKVFFLPFEIISTDFADPVMYHKKNRFAEMAKILSFTCHLTRTINLELLSDHTTISE